VTRVPVISLARPFLHGFHKQNTPLLLFRFTHQTMSTVRA
jgi:hypothetical protein